MAEAGGQPQRICVLGCGGTGKSTLSRLLGERLGLPVHHLDAVIWRAGWVLPPLEERLNAQRGLAEGDRWVIDGNWAATMPERFERTQAIVWLDLPTRVALYGALRRLAHYRGRWRTDMAEGCVERFDWPFIKYILEFREKHRHKITDNLRDFAAHARLYHVTHRRQLPGVVEALMD